MKTTVTLLASSTLFELVLSRAEVATSLGG